MVALIGAVVEHMLRIMFFCHNGKGLPSKKNGLLYTLLVVLMGTRLLRDAVNPDSADALVTSIASMLSVVLMFAILSPRPMAVVVLANTFSALLMSAVYIAGVEFAYLSDVILVWELLAILFATHKVVQAARREHIENSKK